MSATKQEIIEACAEAAHEAWLEEKTNRLKSRDPLGKKYGYISKLSWPSETGEEQLVHWDVLSESVREFDRIVVGAIVDVMVARRILEID